MGESAMVNSSDVGSLVEFTATVSHLSPTCSSSTPGQNFRMSEVDCLSCGLWCERNRGGSCLETFIFNFFFFPFMT